jgi:hypothetical protein
LQDGDNDKTGRACAVVHTAISGDASLPQGKLYGSNDKTTSCKDRRYGNNDSGPLGYPKSGGSAELSWLSGQALCSASNDPTHHHHCFV